MRLLLCVVPQGTKATADHLEDVWRRMLEGDKKNFIITASVPDDPAVDYKAKVGIIEDHAYAILRVVELPTGERLMRIRNPWGQVRAWLVMWREGA